MCTTIYQIAWYITPSLQTEIDYRLSGNMREWGNILLISKGFIHEARDYSPVHSTRFGATDCPYKLHKKICGWNLQENFAINFKFRDNIIRWPIGWVLFNLLLVNNHGHITVGKSDRKEIKRKSSSHRHDHIKIKSGDHFQNSRSPAGNRGSAKIIYMPSSVLIFSGMSLNFYSWCRTILVKYKGHGPASLVHCVVIPNVEQVKSTSPDVYKIRVHPSISLSYPGAASSSVNSGWLRLDQYQGLDNRLASDT